VKRTLKNGSILSTMYAVFNGAKQITRWDSRKDKAIASFRRSNQALTGGQFTIRRQVFVTPAGEKGGIS
jgi:hypothetical protein